MIIYNLKGLLVGIIMAALLALMVYIDFTPAYWFLVSGGAGMYASIKLSKKGEGFFKLPSVFFIPTHAFAGLFILLGLFGLTKNSSFFDHGPIDLRGKMLEQDIALLKSKEISGIDSIAAGMKAYLVGSVIRQLKPEKISCLVKEDTAQNKVLVLIQFPKLKDLEGKMKDDFFKLVDDYILINDFFSDKKIYTGVFDNNGLELLKTPEKPYTSFLVLDSYLEPFYSDSVIIKK